MQRNYDIACADFYFYGRPIIMNATYYYITNARYAYLTLN